MELRSGRKKDYTPLKIKENTFRVTSQSAAKIKKNRPLSKRVKTISKCKIIGGPLDT
jgi:hypothetical protein